MLCGSSFFCEELVFLWTNFVLWIVLYFCHTVNDVVLWIVSCLLHCSIDVRVDKWSDVRWKVCCLRMLCCFMNCYCLWIFFCSLNNLQFWNFLSFSARFVLFWMVCCSPSGLLFLHYFVFLLIAGGSVKGFWFLNVFSSLKILLFSY